MTSISYEDIFSSFLGNVTDYNLTSLSVTDAYEIMTEYLHQTVADPYVYHLFSTCKLDDETQTFSYTLSYPIEENMDNEFVITALAKWMTYVWLHMQVKSVLNTVQAFMGKEQKYYSQAQHLSELRGLQDDAFKDARFFIQNRTFINNNYLGGA